MILIGRGRYLLFYFYFYLAMQHPLVVFFHLAADFGTMEDNWVTFDNVID